MVKDKKDNSPLPGQKSLTSFFGVPRSKKTGEAIQPKKKLQGTIKSGLKKQAAADSSIAATKTEDSGISTSNSNLENVENCDTDKKLSPVDNNNDVDEPTKKKKLVKKEKKKDDDLMDTDDEEFDESNDKKPAAAEAGAGDKKSRKRVIDDDSDSDAAPEESDEAEEEEEYANDDEEEEEEEEENEDEEEEVQPADSPTIQRVAKASKAKPEPAQNGSSSSSSPPKAKKQKTLTGKKAPPPTTKGSKKSSVSALQMKSNTKLQNIMSSALDSHDTSQKLWKVGDSTLYSALCDTFSDVEEISSRLDIQEKLTELFRKVLLMDGGGDQDDDDDEDMKDMEEKKKESSKPSTAAAASSKKGGKKAEEDTRSDLYTLLYLCSNQVAPQHANVELGVGDSILIKAIGEASGTAPNMIKKKYEKEGDLGSVAMTAKGKQRTLVGFGRMSGPKRLSCKDVLMVFKEIANTSGGGSQKWKVDKIKALLVRAKGNEAKFIIRGLQGKLRIGVSGTTVLTSLAHAIVLTKPKKVVELTDEELAEIRKLDDTSEAYPDTARRLCGKKQLPLDEQLDASMGVVKKAYSEVPSYDSVLDALLNYPLQEIHKHCCLKPGIPVEPMLAKPTKSVLEVLKRLNGLRFTCEYKYDGERAQVHMLSNSETKVFSRSLLNTSEKYPEVPLYVQESCKTTGVTSFVLDTEVVAFDRDKGQFVPFQILSTRKKTEDSAESAKVQVIVQAFDLMYLNGESLLDRTLAERRDLMKKNFLPTEGKFQYATSLDHEEDGDTAVLEEFLDTSVKNQCEGLMVKTLDVNAAYEPSRRSLNWLKLKKDYLEGLGDSVDLVPIGAYHGRGKRTGVYGGYLLACYDEDTEEFQTVCKVGTGFSDEDLKDLSASLNNHVIPNKSSQYNVADSNECDVWFDAVQVWEVKAADLSKSSTHKGAIGKLGEAGRGIGLRFPRFERVRPDKKPDAATSSDQILDMYYAQDSVIDGPGGGGGMDLDDGI